MIRIALIALAVFALAGCGGMVAYDTGSQIRSGSLGRDTLNQMGRPATLTSSSNADQVKYAIDRGGKFTGVCKTVADRERSRMDLAVYDALGTKRWSMDQTQLGRRIDAAHGSTNYGDIVKDGTTEFFVCWNAGASGSASALVLFLSLHSASDAGTPPDIAIVINVESKKVVDVELFQRGSAPNRIRALANPLGGHTVAISGGQIMIDGMPLTSSGNPVRAKTVKHHFR